MVQMPQGYRLIRKLGAGGMGEVVLAEDERVGRWVAIKVLSAVGSRGNTVERFRNEARIHRSLYHPGIATLYDYLEVGGVPYLVMEWVDGPPLLEWTSGRSWRDRLWCFGEIACALAYLHARHVVHRDIKPANIRIGQDGRPRLLDFGIAHDSRTPHLTTIGLVPGTLNYMAPELLRGEPASPQSDVWAWGVSLYEVLTGQVPFDGATDAELCRRISQERPIGVRRSMADLPPACEDLLRRCLEKQPRLRPANGDALAAAVDTILSNQPLTGASWSVPRPLRWTLAASAVLGGVTVVAILVTSATSRPPTPAPPPLPAAASLPVRSEPPATHPEPAAPKTMVRVRFEGMYGQREIYISGHKIGTTDFNHEFEYGQTLDVECRNGNQPVERRTLDVGLQTNLTCTQ
jgi:serine/threonine-protein kinase